VTVRSGLGSSGFVTHWFQPVGKNVWQPFWKLPSGPTVMKYSWLPLRNEGTVPLPPTVALSAFAGDGFGAGAGAGNAVVAAASGAGAGTACAAGSSAIGAGRAAGGLLGAGSVAGTGLLNARLGSTCTTGGHTT
jgi:hypothetical protein